MHTSLYPGAEAAPDGLYLIMALAPIDSYSSLIIIRFIRRIISDKRRSNTDVESRCVIPTSPHRR